MPNINQMELNGLPSTPQPAVTYHLLTQKPNQCVARPRYMCDQILVKLAPAVTKILYLHGSLGHQAAETVTSEVLT